MGAARDTYPALSARAPDNSPTSSDDSNSGVVLPLTGPPLVFPLSFAWSASAIRRSTVPWNARSHS